MSDDKFRIIPERDNDDVPVRETRESRSSKSVKAEPPQRENSSRSEKASNHKTTASPLALILALISIVGAGFLLFQWQAQVNLNAGLEQRVKELEMKLDVTGESMSQSGAAMQVTLKEHSNQLELQMSEIRKLWDLSNKTNKTKIEANEKAIASLNTQVKTLQNLSASVQKAQQSLEALQKQVTTNKGSVDSLGSRMIAVSAELDDVSNKAKLASDAAGKVQSNLSTLNAQMAKNTEAIASIDAFRREVNERLLKMQQQMYPTIIGQ